MRNERGDLEVNYTLWFMEKYCFITKSFLFIINVLRVCVLFILFKKSSVKPAKKWN